MVKIGREEPALSMDVNGGKIIWARHSEIQQANLKAMGETEDIKDGERLPLNAKDMGSSEVYPQTIAHSPNGRYVVRSVSLSQDYRKEIRTLCSSGKVL